MSEMNQPLIVVAGATGNLGSKIIKHLLEKKARVRALVRLNADTKNLRVINHPDFEVVEVDYDEAQQLRTACKGAHCVVSAMSGLRDVLIDTQLKLVQAAEDAGVKKFIPSDYCIDYEKLSAGENRNLDLRREFASLLIGKTIAVTSVLNGMFMDLLLKEAPVILFEKKRIFFWGNADQKMDFTSIDNTAAFTALAAIDPQTPRWLRIAGAVASMRDLKTIAGEVTGTPYKFLRPGGLTGFKVIIKITKLFSPGRNETFPVWQGMQYLYDMLSGKPKFNKLDNDRYRGIQWTALKEIIASRHQ